MPEQPEPTEEQSRIGASLKKLTEQLRESQAQKLLKIREYWNEWTEEERDEFRKWITDVEAIERRKPRIYPPLNLRVEFIEKVGDDDYDRISPGILGIKLAVDAWADGREYEPTSVWEMI